MQIPTFCTRGHVFSSGMSIEGENITLTSNKAGPCPVCGQMGDVLEGDFNIKGNEIEVLRVSEAMKKYLT